MLAHTDAPTGLLTVVATGEAPTVRGARVRPEAGHARLAAAAALLALIALFHGTATEIARQWWNDPEAGHGLILVPFATYLAWKRGLDTRASPSVRSGALLLAAAVLLRLGGELAAELFVGRLALVVALAGLVVHYVGWRQLRAWWLAAVLLLLAIPLPAVVVGTLSLPLQLEASELGAAMLRARFIPVQLSGNIIQLSGQSLFVSEACSGLRSLMALLSLGVVVGAMGLRRPASRLCVVLAAVPIAVLVNGARIFVTGFLVHHVSPAAGQGFMHTSEGWLMFAAALCALALLAAALRRVETVLARRAA